MKRCRWCLGSDLYVNYHDEEWGVPVFDEGDEILRWMIRSDGIPNPDEAKYYLGDGYVHEDIDERVSDGDPDLEGKTNGIKVVQSLRTRADFQS